jgi:hypothetical protein
MIAGMILVSGQITMYFFRILEGTELDLIVFFASLSLMIFPRRIAGIIENYLPKKKR